MFRYVKTSQFFLLYLHCQSNYILVGSKFQIEPPGYRYKFIVLSSDLPMYVKFVTIPITGNVYMKLN